MEDAFKITQQSVFISRSIYSNTQKGIWEQHVTPCLVHYLPVSERDSGRLLTMCSFSSALPGTPHNQHVFGSCGPAEQADGNKGASSQPGPAASVKCQEEGGRKAASGGHESKLNKDRHHHVSQDTAIKDSRHTHREALIPPVKLARPFSSSQTSELKLFFFLPETSICHEGNNGRILAGCPGFSLNAHMFCESHLLPTSPLKS